MEWITTYYNQFLGGKGRVEILLNQLTEGQKEGPDVPKPRRHINTESLIVFLSME